ncbi:MAG: DNA polymerase-1, partial [Candidatus Endobugula sp.]
MSKPEKSLFLLDAFALIYRAHFAFSKNPRISSKGLNTGAAFGFTNSLFEIIDKQKPTHIAVAFDMHGPTFRHIQYPEYKANRDEQPEDIRIAIPTVKDIVRAFNIPVLELEGYEADDVIGTFAKKASAKGFEVFMMTPDKDYGQLVEKHVYLYKPAFMGNSVDVMGIPEILAKWDIERIDQVIEMLGLQGDAVDNIPGIPGVGPKTASKLLKDYGTIEGIIAHSHELKGKLKERVEAFAEQGLLSKELATICTTVPIEFDEEAMKYTGPNIEKLTEIFEQLEFRTTLKRILGDTGTSTATASKPKAQSTAQMGLFGDNSPTLEKGEEGVQAPEKQSILTVEHDYHLVDTPSLRKRLIKYLMIQKEFCFDTETDN